MNLSTEYIKFMSTFFVIILISCYIVPMQTLPVTSKPIENTPEHLAWEAWVMLPPSPNERTRKITPKSIFILPNTSSGSSDGNSENNMGIQPQAQVQCPHGYREDNSKCIRIISLNHQELVVQQLSSFLSNQENDPSNTGSSTAYEEFDYDNYDTPMTFDSEDLPETSITYLNKGPTENQSAEQPLKINFSLDKFGIVDKFINNVNIDSMEKSEEVKNRQPFEVQIHTEKTISTTVPKKIEEDIMEAASTNNAMTSKLNDSNLTIAIITPSILSANPIIAMNNTEMENTLFDTVTSSTTTESFIIQMDLSDDQDDYGESTTLPPMSNAASTTFTILSSAETELDDLNNTKSENEVKSTNSVNENLEIVTELSETQKIIEDNLAEESFVIDRQVKDNSTTEHTDETTEEFVEGTTNRNEFDDTTTNEPTYDLIAKDFEIKKKTEVHKVENISEEIKRETYLLKKEKSSNEQNEFESVTEPIENDNRFVYHNTELSAHSDSSNSDINSKSPISSKSIEAQDIQQQLRIINMIVEENKRKQELQRQTKIRFPSDSKGSNLQREGLRADIIRFPEVTSPTVVSSSSPSHFSFQTNNFDPQKFDPNKFLFHRKFFQPITTIAPTPAPTTENSKTKPFWWLPSGWDADQNEEKPLLISFWARASPQPALSTQAPSLNYDATTSGYRENSRYPTDNLYREISAQEVYKVLGAARQWKHSSKR